MLIHVKILTGTSCGGGNSISLINKIFVFIIDRPNNDSLISTLPKFPPIEINEN